MRARAAVVSRTSQWCLQRKIRTVLGRMGWGIKAPEPLWDMPGEREGGRAETLPRPGVKIEDGSRVRPGFVGVMEGVDFHAWPVATTGPDLPSNRSPARKALV